ncbi:helix-turn-helix transcriptional regulator [Nakamurella sp. PAMC28650]|uniref:helix-turn-helix transcriptional regulator n=1 Tax=Nakamurella sp. PAMC28650 TaxID=2762325 RepID=UPI00164D7901|nr:helix-turn-helix transcriptional regulator [Nakamurella sp. PAMC28650]QNK80296.1 helix-turn-helix domain-containing protein [Nakamurella sp. PAMC28650]
MERTELADFLRRRREALQPGDVGLTKGPRRRTAGLRREEVAALSGMSTDTYSRLEQQRGARPSEQMLGALARGLRLSLDERDHLFRMAGHSAPARLGRSGHVGPALMRVLDRLHDTPAMVIDELGETLVQNPMAVALLGRQTGFSGLDRIAVYRWFTDPSERSKYPDRDHGDQSRLQVAQLRAAVSRAGASSRAGAVVRALLAASPEFVGHWARHEVAVKATQHKTLVHPELGEIQLHCQLLVDENDAQTLVIFTAVPGSVDDGKLALLSVIGTQSLGAEDSTPDARRD